MFVKRVFYFFIKRDLDKVLKDLIRNGYLPEKGGLGFQNFIKILEFGCAEQEIYLIEKDLLKIVGDRGELILVK
jgi:hypothetical protein